VRPSCSQTSDSSSRTRSTGNGGRERRSKRSVQSHDGATHRRGPRREAATLGIRAATRFRSALAEGGLAPYPRGRFPLSAAFRHGLAGHAAYTSDLADRLTAITSASGSATTFTIDPLGRRASRTIGTAPIESYSYLGSTNTVIGITSGSTTTVSAIDAVVDRVATGSGGAVALLLPDLHGTAAASTRDRHEHHRAPSRGELRLGVAVAARVVRTYSNGRGERIRADTPSPSLLIPVANIPSSVGRDRKTA
jgi:YD repeat-containing protein